MDCVRIAAGFAHINETIGEPQKEQELPTQRMRDRRGGTGWFS